MTVQWRDPWSTSDNPLGSNAPQPKHLTRADLIELAARAIMGCAPEREWTADDEAPVSTFGSVSARTIFTEYAADALDAAYPQVVNAEEIEALGWRAVIVNDQGHVRQRTIAPDNHLDHGGKPWSQPGGETGRHRIGWSSASLVASGPWTVVHRGQK